jgi:hypothetical protein
MGSSVQSVALSINDSGQVAGTVGNDSFITSPDGQTIDLGTFGGTSSGPIAVNNLGHVVGVYSSRSGFGGFPIGGEYFYTGAGESHNGGIGLGVLALNDSDETVGTNNTYSGGAEMATANGTVYNLDTLYASLLVPIGGTKAGFVTLDSATGVDDSGNIIGYGSYYNGDSTNDLFERGFLLSVDSVPEPNALILLPLGLLFIEIVRRRAKIKT